MPAEYKQKKAITELLDNLALVLERNCPGAHKAWLYIDNHRKDYLNDYYKGKSLEDVEDDMYLEASVALERKYLKQLFPYKEPLDDVFD